MTDIRLCTGVLERTAGILLVASRYPNQPVPLWGLPGGRPKDGELLRDALVREFREETGLDVEVGRLLYVSESFDRTGGVHVANATFAVTARGEARRAHDPHVVALEWVPRDDLGARLIVRVVREPLLAALGGDPAAYYGFDDAGITIEFVDEP